MEIVLHWVTQYGYIGIFSLLVLGIVGLPIPDETLLTFAGYLVYRGWLHLLPTLASAFLGSVCGITLSWILGRTFGLLLVNHYGHYFHVTEERLEQVHHWFKRAGRWALTLGYYVPGVRHLTAYVAGASRLELPIFALFAYSGALLWSVSFITLGYFLGEEWTRSGARIQRNLEITGALTLAAVFLYFSLRRRKSSGRG